ncbi:MAG: GntR family transcriptional regulator, transcriptional repressor for pyruvate dehydrogenase complex [Thermotogaceae bacterium]|jgi:GntR family transcriptional repressor for pyruvate dehydrogenase complex|nr:GntR family transcriptional regulator, transcriptional repressor for pyruvate dehydrogenase complex [Thermotogaceae bacterium]
MYSRKDRKALNVVNDIKKFILEKNPVRLPSEVVLAKKFGVSRTIIREALRILEYEGITHTIQGSGTYVKRRDGIGISVDISLEVRSNDPEQILELIEVRRCLESGAIRLAILNATDEQISELENALLALENSIQKHEILSEVDEYFHKKIFEIANNEILRKTFEAIFSVLGILWHSPLGLKNFGDRGLPYHRLLFEKIKERNVEEALEVYQKIIDLDIEDIIAYENEQFQERNE